jgi:hypothetical protein
MWSRMSVLIIATKTKYDSIDEVNCMQMESFSDKLYDVSVAF